MASLWRMFTIFTTDSLVLNHSRGASQWLALDYRNRPSRDQFWGILYLILMALTLTGGIYGIVNR